jgi:hypothetical protein
MIKRAEDLLLPPAGRQRFRRMDVTRRGSDFSCISLQKIRNIVIVRVRAGIVSQVGLRADGTRRGRTGKISEIGRKSRRNSLKYHKMRKKMADYLTGEVETERAGLK